jgi:hypothetical protein
MLERPSSDFLRRHRRSNDGREELKEPFREISERSNKTERGSRTHDLTEQDAVDLSHKFVSDILTRLTQADSDLYTGKKG